MRKYDKGFKEETVKLSNEIGVKKTAAQLGIPYYSLAEWGRPSEITPLSAGAFAVTRRFPGTSAG